MLADTNTHLCGDKNDVCSALVVIHITIFCWHGNWNIANVLLFATSLLLTPFAGIDVCSIYNQGFFKENARYPVWIGRDPISLILGTRFSLTLGTRS